MPDQPAPALRASRLRAGSGARPCGDYRPQWGYILPCNSLRGAARECEVHDARFHPSYVHGELIGIALHGVPLSVVVRADNSAILTYVVGDTVYISRGQCREAEAPVIARTPVGAALPM